MSWAYIILFILIIAIIFRWNEFFGKSNKRWSGKSKTSDENGLLDKTKQAGSSVLNWFSSLFKDDKEAWYNKNGVQTFLAIFFVIFLLYQIDQDFTTNVVLKANSILLIGILVFGYYIRKKDPKRPPVKHKIGWWLISLSIFVFLINSLYPYFFGEEIEKETGKTTISEKESDTGKSENKEKNIPTPKKSLNDKIGNIKESAEQIIFGNFKNDEEMQSHIKLMQEDPKFRGKKLVREGLEAKSEFEFGRNFTLPVGYTFTIIPEKGGEIYYRVNRKNELIFMLGNKNIKETANIEIPTTEPLTIEVKSASDKPVLYTLIIRKNKK